METLIGVGIWICIFVVWYVRHYPQRFSVLQRLREVKIRWPEKKRAIHPAHEPKARSRGDFKALAETVESISSRDRMGSSDAAAMVLAVRGLMEIEPASAQMWEALALDALETAEIVCDQCHIPVERTVKKTGVKIKCSKCLKWIALKNSKVTIIDPKRPDLEEWEH